MRHVLHRVVQFRMKAAHYDLSVKITRKLRREIEELDLDAVATECGTCMLQIEARQDTRKVVHPVVLLCHADQKAGRACGGPEAAIAGRMERVSFPEGRTAMTVKKEELTGVEGLAETGTYGKFRCHNPSCMARIIVEPGATHCKCPMCGLEWRVSWVAPGFPRIRGPVWDVNQRIAQEAAKKRD